MSSGVVVQQKEERESGEIAQWAKHMLNKADLDLSLTIILLYFYWEMGDRYKITTGSLWTSLKEQQ